MAFPPSAVPALELPGLDGRPVSLAGTWSAGAGLLVIGHGECATTRLTLPFVERLHRQAPHGGVTVVLQDAKEDASALSRELGLSMPVLLEGEPYPLTSELGVRTVPTLLLLDASGRVEEAREGFRRDDLEALAARLGAGPLFTAADSAPASRPG